MRYAVGKGHLQALDASMKRTKDHGEDGSAALIDAAMIGDTHAVQALLDCGVPINATDSNGRSALIEAAFGGHPATVSLLLGRAADPNARDADGFTPLMEAASNGRADIVWLLLCYGADSQLKSNKGWTALRLAPKGNAELMAMLRPPRTTKAEFWPHA